MEGYHVFSIRENGKIIAQTYIFYVENDQCTILSLDTDINHQNKGHATKLLIKIEEFCRKNKVVKIILDDCTDNYRKPNNIYLKNGFNYIEDGFPEMTKYLN